MRIDRGSCVVCARASRSSSSRCWRRSAFTFRSTRCSATWPRCCCTRLSPSRSEPVEFELAPLADASPKPVQAEMPEPNAVKSAPKPSRPRSRARRSAAADRRSQSRRPRPSEAGLSRCRSMRCRRCRRRLRRPPDENKLAVTQKSDDPNVAPPDNARFIAEENRASPEETVARARNMQRDDPVPTPQASNGEQPRTNRGRRRRARPTSRICKRSAAATSGRRTRRRPSRSRERRRSHRRASAKPTPWRRRPQAAPSESRAAEAQRARRDRAGRAEPETLVVQDGAGQFTIRKRRRGRGADDAGGAAAAGGSPSARSVRYARDARARASNLRVTFSQFESTFGADELREQREAYLEQRKSQSPADTAASRCGRSSARRSRTSCPTCSRAQQTALNAAASPFARLPRGGAPAHPSRVRASLPAQLAARRRAVRAIRRCTPSSRS